MRALILCAGYGTRLRPITNKIPKCMVEVAGAPVLQHLVNYLHSYGIFEIVVNVHYKPEKIMGYFGSSLLYLYEPVLLGEVGTIDALAHWFKDDYTVVMNGDTLTTLNLTEMFTFSGGKNVKSMDGEVYTGTKILSPDYFSGNRNFGNYMSSDLWWQDIGTHKGLKKARKEYEKIANLSTMSSGIKN